MIKDAALMGATLLCSIAISFGAATYLLNNELLCAVALITLYFFGGLWAPGGRIGTKTHASWIGISIEFFGAILFLYRLSLSNGKSVNLGADMCNGSRAAVSDVSNPPEAKTAGRKEDVDLALWVLVHYHFASKQLGVSSR